MPLCWWQLGQKSVCVWRRGFGPPGLFLFWLPPPHGDRGNPFTEANLIGTQRRRRDHAGLPRRVPLSREPVQIAGGDWVPVAPAITATMTAAAFAGVGEQIPLQWRWNVTVVTAGTVTVYVG
jgi:hypothetical protein